MQFDSEEALETTELKRKSNLNSKMPEGKGLQKYWIQRYRLFSRFDEGIQLDNGESCIFPSNFTTPLTHKLTFFCDQNLGFQSHRRKLHVTSLSGVGVI